MLNGKVVLVTAETDSLGTKFVILILIDYPDVKIIYSHDESASDLITNSKTVATIIGTAGWKTIALKNI